MGDWALVGDWGLGLAIGIGDYDWGLRIGIEDWDSDLALGLGIRIGIWD